MSQHQHKFQGIARKCVCGAELFGSQTPLPRGKIDWLAVEQAIRDALKNAVLDGNGNVYNATADSHASTLQLISEIIGRHTGRGYPIKDDGTLGIC